MEFPAIEQPEIEKGIRLAFKHKLWPEVRRFCGINIKEKGFGLYLQQLGLQLSPLVPSGKQLIPRR